MSTVDDAAAPAADDAALALAMAGRDPAGLDLAYRRYAGRLYTYARTLTGDRESAIDIVHDTFLLAAEHATQLRDPSRLRPWLYAIARNVGLRHLRRQARHAPLELAGDVAADTIDLAGKAHAIEVAGLVRSAMGGLSEKDREVVELAVRHRLTVAEIASVLEIPLNQAHARLSRVREQFLVCLGVLLVAREPQCAELSALLRDWDGRLNPLLRKRLNRHIDGCATCKEVRQSRLNPTALLSAVATLPFLSAPGLQRTGLLRPTGEATAIPASSEIAWNKDGFPVAVRERSKVRLAVAAGVAAALLIAGGGVAATLHNGQSESPNTGASLKPVELTASPVPSATSSPTPSSSPSPSKSTTPALSFTAVGTATCIGGLDYKVKVTVTANTNLTTATLYRPGAIPMTVSGKTATHTVTVFGGSSLTWHVSVVDNKGRTLTGSDKTTANPGPC